jgi:hypothetical protein
LLLPLAFEDAIAAFLELLPFFVLGLLFLSGDLEPATPEEFEVFVFEAEFKSTV